jgi:uncharacterized protein YjgD (DUF1641 family)
METTTELRIESRDEALLAELRAIHERLEGIEGVLRGVTHRVESLEDLREDLWPMVEGMSHSVTRTLHELDRAGAIGFARESVKVAERVATSFDEDDVRQLGENVVTILRTVQGLTQPEVLDMAERSVAALRADDSHDEPGLFRALRDPEVRRGMRRMLRVLRELGAEPSARTAVTVRAPATPVAVDAAD